MNFELTNKTNKIFFDKNHSKIRKAFFNMKNSNEFYLDILNGFEDINDYACFSDIPILTKDIFLDNYNLFFEPVKNKKLAFYSTSGTSGKHLRMFRTKSDDVSQNVILNSYRVKHCPQIAGKNGLHFSFMFRDSASYLLTKPFEIVKYNNNFEMLRYFVVNDFLLEKALKYINEFKPSWIIGSVSFIEKLAEYEIKNKLLKHKLDYIECNSEYMDQPVIEVVMKAFDVIPISIYGSNEHAAIAYQCKNGNMHVIEENVFVEILKNKNVIVTSLLNKNTGLLRYEQGDIAEWSPSKCFCDLRGPIIQLTGFRKNDCITYGNTSIDMWFFNGLVKLFRKKHNINIKQYKVIQENRNINVQLVVTNSNLDFLKKEITLIIIDKFNSIFNNELIVKVDFVDDIQINAASGKFKYFERR